MNCPTPIPPSHRMLGLPECSEAFEFAQLGTELIGMIQVIYCTKGRRVIFSNKEPTACRSVDLELQPWS